MAKDRTTDEIHAAVRDHYAAAARNVRQPGGCGCGPAGESAFGWLNYDWRLLQELPKDAVLASLGCGNPVLMAELEPGEKVLDLGSGGGIDVLLSARRVGPEGLAYGLDMTDEMLELANANARTAGVTNVRFLKGHIEDIPLPDAGVDVIISNCVINLAADKDAVLREAFRVLKHGGRLAVSDVVIQGGELPDETRRELGLWAECVAGALTDEQYRAKLAVAGFVDVDLAVLNEYAAADLGSASCCGSGSAASCCGPAETAAPTGCCDAESTANGCSSCGEAPAGLALPPGVRVVSALIKARKA